MGFNPLIAKKIESLDINDEDKEIIKKLLNAEYSKQTKGEKNYVDDYDELLASGLVDDNTDET